MQLKMTEKNVRQRVKTFANVRYFPIQVFERFILKSKTTKNILAVKHQNVSLLVYALSSNTVTRLRPCRLDWYMA